MAREEGVCGGEGRGGGGEEGESTGAFCEFPTFSLHSYSTKLVEQVLVNYNLDSIFFN